MHVKLRGNLLLKTKAALKIPYLPTTPRFTGHGLETQPTENKQDISKLTENARSPLTHQRSSAACKRASKPNVWNIKASLEVLDPNAGIKVFKKRKYHSYQQEPKQASNCERLWLDLEEKDVAQVEKDTREANRAALIGEPRRLVRVVRGEAECGEAQEYLRSQVTFWLPRRKYERERENRLTAQATYVAKMPYRGYIIYTIWLICGVYLRKKRANNSGSDENMTSPECHRITFPMLHISEYPYITSLHTIKTKAKSELNMCRAHPRTAGDRIDAIN
ncbi:hypothetical protein B0H11DRAFT_1912529 [Mycena galericulata]|nr:hypothetical protein B0H11DRAFT_1912529 [Mycena galericulata]